ncbi:MAG: diaminopimelate decarboxylase [Myxococcales bacterium]
MHHFDRRGGVLHCEDVPLHEIAAQVGTPTYVYSHATLERHFRVFDGAFADHPHLICYSVKACSNVAVLRLFRALGSGFDIVSGGELYRALRAGADPRSIVFSGVGKRDDEIVAALDAGVLCLNVESEEELVVTSAIAEARGGRAPVALRINPDVDPETHPYISTGLRTSKFGIPISRAREVYALARRLPGIEVIGLDCHIGSQLTQTEPIIASLRRLLSLVEELRADGTTISHLDLGGGLGIAYDQETPPHPADYARAIIDEVRGRDLTLVFEPGRVIVGNAGVLLTRVLFTKSNDAKDFVVVDAGMNDALRPSLYGAWHSIEPVVAPEVPGRSRVDVVGPVCETGDFLARDRELSPVCRGDLLAMMSAGAYGFSMASNYNSRARAAEVMVRGREIHVIRAREELDDLARGELVPPFLRGGPL